MFISDDMSDVVFCFFIISIRFASLFVVKSSIKNQKHAPIYLSQYNRAYENKRDILKIKNNLKNALLRSGKPMMCHHVSDLSATA